MESSTLAKPDVSERMYDLDGLRAIAVSLVLIDHFVTICVPVYPLQNICSFGWVGVDLFFVISGFLIGGLLLDHRSAANYYRVFYVRRFFRIIPLYALLLLPMFAVLAMGWQNRLAGHKLGALSWGILLLYVFFQQNLGNGLFFATPGYLAPAWSLAIEEQFYILCPPLVRNLTRANLLKVILAAIVTAPLLRTFLVWHYPNARWAMFAPTMLLPCRWDVLSMGVLVAWLVRDVRFVPWILKHIAGLRGVAIVLGLGVLGMAVAGLRTENAIISTFGYSWIAVFFGVVLLLSRVNASGSIRHWLSHPVFRPLATISYGVYMIQGPTLAIRQTVLVDRLHWLDHYGTTVLANLLTVTATVILAMISWKYFESRMIRVAHQERFKTLEGR